MRCCKCDRLDPMMFNCQYGYLCVYCTHDQLLKLTSAAEVLLNSVKQDDEGDMTVDRGALEYMSSVLGNI